MRAGRDPTARRRAGIGLRRFFGSGGVPALMVLGGVVGVVAGLGAVVLILAIEGVAAGVAAVASDPGIDRLGMFVVIPVALWLSWQLTVRFAPEVAGHGVPHILEAITVRGGLLRPRVAPLKVVATGITIGAGGSAGREGAIAQIGAATGSWIARRTGLGENDVAALVAAGAGAGISATFNAPIAGMFFALEVILRSFSVRHLQAVLVASVAGAVVSHRLLGEELTFRVFPYDLAEPRELVLYVVLGFATAGAAWVFLRLLDWWDPGPRWLSGAVRPVAAGLAVATVGLWWPEVLGTGQEFIGRVLRDEVAAAWWLFGLLALTKAVATSATLGGKGSGGIFMPSLFKGATVGSGFARLVAPIWTASTLNPGAFGLVGMAATFAGVARAPLTSVLIVFEVTGDYGLVLPLMIATSISTYVAARLHPDSAYTAPLAKKGIHPTRTGDVDVLDTITVGEVTGGTPVVVTPELTLEQLETILVEHRLHGAPVVDEDGRLVGVVTVTDILRAGGPSPEVAVRDAMTPDPATVSTDTPVSEALERMASLGVGRLPVVDPRNPDRLVAVFRREDAVYAYHQALSASARLRHPRYRAQVPTGSDAEFFEFEIPNGSPAAGRKISEFAWPEGCLLVSVHRGERVLIARGDLRLQAGDAVTAFGGPGVRRRVLERVRPHRAVQAPTDSGSDVEG